MSTSSKRKPAGPKYAPTSMRFTDADLRLLKRLADEDYRTVTALIRWMAHQEDARRRNGKGSR